MEAIQPVSTHTAVATATSGHPSATAQVPVQTPPAIKQAVAEPKVSEQALKEAVLQANRTFAGSNEAVSFTYEEKLGQLFVQITDSKSGEVIREVPSREFIRHQVAMKEFIGLLLDKQV